MSIWNHGILGINARNLLYIKPYNPKLAVKLADDKIKTKQFLHARGIPVPKMIARISEIEDLEKFDWNVLPSSFVLKPNAGFGGEGIVVIKDRKKSSFIKINGERLSKYDLEDHIESILAGRFSISNTYDTAFFEQRLVPHEFFGNFTNTGLPDLRIVVHNLIPVMAMIRIPTKASEGKANVHLGGVGIGIDIAKGETTHAVQYNKIIHEIPGFGDFRGLKVPFWDDILYIASKLQQITNLGYLACDIVIDKNAGPVLLELNARAGLMVQIANLSPLRKRLERIKGIKVNSPEKGVRIGQDLFGQKIEKEIEDISGKMVIGEKENIEILLSQGGTKTVFGMIRPDMEKTVFSKKLMNELQEMGEVKQEGEESYKVKFNLGSKKIQTLIGVENMDDKPCEVLVGIRDLKGMLIDPLKPYSPLGTKPRKLDYSSIDQRLCDIDSKIKLIGYLNPMNLEEEKQKVLENAKYNPQFQYRELDFDPEDLLDRIKYIETDASPMGVLYAKKKEEIEYKIRLLMARGDAEKFTEISSKLYEKPRLSLVRDAKKRMADFLDYMNDDSLMDEGDDEGGYENLPTSHTKEKSKKKEDDKKSKDSHFEKRHDHFEAAKYFEEVFHTYHLDDWKVVVKKNMVVDCSAGKNGSLFVKEGAMFSDFDLERLTRHEIETHILTAVNGKIQRYNIFQQGFGYYLKTQEGLAIYNEIHHTKDHKGAAGRGVLAVHFALEGSFSETYQKLLSLGIEESLALRTALKVKRGLSDTELPGGFTKEAIYTIGYEMVKKYIDEGNDILPLYYGKISLEDLEYIQKIDGIVDPKYLPKFLEK